MRVRMTIVAGLAAGAAVLGGGTPASAGGGCMHGTGPSDGEGSVVELVDACFTPTVLRVDPGAEVTFVNRDAVAHQITGVGGAWGGFDDIQPGDRVSYAFEDDGVYVYSCFVHPGMVGAVVAGSGGDLGSADPVPTGPPEAAAGAASPEADDRSDLGAVLVGGTIGLVVGGGLASAAVRRRRSAAGAGTAA
jgi:plastocyanin